MGILVARLEPILLVPLLPYAAERVAFQPAPSLSVVRGTVMGQITNATNDVDTVTMTGTGGQWALTVQNNEGTYTASNLAYNISTAALQAALQALPNLGAGDVTVSGTAGSSYVLTGAGSFAGFPLGIITVDATNGGVTPLTGGTVTVVHTTTNNLAGQIKPYASGNSDGSQTPVGLTIVDFTTDQNGNITLGAAHNEVWGNFTAPGFGIAIGHTSSVPLFVSGWFRESDLTGLDSTAVTAFKGREFVLNDGTKSLRIP